MGQVERLRWQMSDWVHGARVFVPPHWPLLLRENNVGGMALIVAMGGDQSDASVNTFGYMHNLRHPDFLDAVVVYPDAIVATDENAKWSSGHTALRGGYIFGDDVVPWITELLHRVRLGIRTRADERRAAMGTATPYEVFDPDRMYLVGYSAGAIMANKVAATENPLSHAADPGYTYQFSGMAVHACTMGGYAYGDERGIPALRHLHEPAAGTPLLDVLWTHGANDSQVAARVPPVPAEDDGLGGGTPNLVCSQTSYDRFLGLVANPEQSARWDYTVEFSVDRWATHMGIALPASAPVTFPVAYDSPSSGNSGAEALFAGGMAASNERLVTLIYRDPSGSIPVGLGGGHAWPDALLHVNKLILDFFAGNWP